MVKCLTRQDSMKLNARARYVESSSSITANVQLRVLAWLGNTSAETTRGFVMQPVLRSKINHSICGNFPHLLSRTRRRHSSRSWPWHVWGMPRCSRNFSCGSTICRGITCRRSGSWSRCGRISLASLEWARASQVTGKRSLKKSSLLRRNHRSFVWRFRVC